MISYSLVFLLRYLGFFSQLDLFILQWEDVLCDGFDLTVLDPSDRRGTEVSSLKEIPTAIVLHHPSLFGEIPT